MYFPRRVGEASPPEDESVGELRVAGEGQAVLMIDDETTIRVVVAESLRQSGYRVFEAEDGSTGLQILQSVDRLDLLITDVACRAA